MSLRILWVEVVVAGWLAVPEAVCAPASSKVSGTQVQRQHTDLARRFSNLGTALGRLDAKEHVNAYAELKADRTLAMAVIQGMSERRSEGHGLWEQLKTMSPGDRDRYMDLFLTGYKRGATEAKPAKPHTKEELLAVAILMYSMDNERFPDMTNMKRLEKSIRPYLSPNGLPRNPARLNTWLSRRSATVLYAAHPVILLFTPHNNSNGLYDVYFTDGKKHVYPANRLRHLMRISHMN